MEGYIKSLSSTWRHIFKRAVSPGGTIPLEELYDTYGKKYNLKPNEEFVAWLKEVKLQSDADSWEISLVSESVPAEKEKPKKDDGLKPVSKSEKATTVVNKLSVEEIVGLPVRKAREVIPNITNLKLLKYALQEAKPRSNKDSLCRILEKRVKDLEIAR